MLRLSLLLLHILFPLIVAGQQLTVVELNCENLFDYRHDEGKNDEDYLPESTRHWTRQRYWRKQNHIAQTSFTPAECWLRLLDDIIARPTRY